jgi:hypothetical protein
MEDETAGIVAAIIAVASVWVAWWGATPRRTRRLRDKVQILDALPPDSAERGNLLKHVDRMVKDEIETDRTDELMGVAWAIAGFGIASWIFISIARDSGGAWWALAFTTSAGFVALVILVCLIFVRWLRQRPGRSIQE